MKTLRYSINFNLSAMQFEKMLGVTKNRGTTSRCPENRTADRAGAGEEWMRLTSTRWIDADPADRMGWLSRYTAAMKISTQPGCNLTYAATLPRGSLAWDNLSLAWKALGRAQDIA